MDVARSERPDGRRSWVVAGVGAVAMIFTFGTPLSYGIFRDPFAAAFDVSPAALSVVFAVMLCTFFIGSGLVGVFGARVPARAVVLACALATGLVAPSLYVVESVVALTAVFAVLGLALGTAYVIVASVVPRWFDRRRGAATGLIFVGNGLGLTVLPPVWNRAFATVGVRRGFLLIVAASAITFFAAGLVCRRPAWADQSTASAGEMVTWLRGIAGTRTFQLLFVGIALSFAWYQLLAAYAVDLFAARGVTRAAASGGFGLVGGVSIASRIGSGYLADRMGTRRAYLASLGSVAVGVAVLFVPHVAALPPAIFLIGLGLGGSATLYIPLLMGTYDPEKDTVIVGVFNVAIGVAALTVPPIGTASITYTDGFTAAVGLTFVAAVGAIWLITRGTALE